MLTKRDFRVLVADDDEIVREIICSLLSREGYRVVQADDGLGAMRILKEESISLVITDLRMPGADGIEVLRSAVKSNPDVAGVILTAYGTLDTTIEAARGGAYYYLTKPFRGQEILLVVERIFQRAELILEKREMAAHLRDTYSDIGALAGSGCCPSDIRGLIERVDKIKSMNVLSEQEAQRIKERLSRGLWNREENGSEEEAAGEI